MRTTMNARSNGQARTTAIGAALALALTAAPALAQATATAPPQPAPAAQTPPAPGQRGPGGPPQGPQGPQAPEGPKPVQAQKSVKLMDGVYELAVSESTDTVFVAATGQGDAKNAAVFVVDGTSLEIKRKIELGETAPYGLGINDKTQTLYSSNTRNGNVSAIDIKTGKTLAQIGDPADPKAHLFKVLVDEANNRTYVSVAGKTGSIWVIDGKTNTLAHIIKEVGVLTIGLAIEPETGMLYAVNQGSKEVVEIDPKSYEIKRRFPLEAERPTMVAIDAKTRRLFVTAQGSGDITVLDTRTGRVLKTVKIGAGALGIVFNPNNNRIYVANRGTGSVSVVNAESYTIESNVSSGSLPNTVAVNTKTNRAYVTNKARRGPRGGPQVEDAAGDTLSLVSVK